MQIASDRGIAPRLCFADALTGISITDRVSGAPLGPNAPDPTRLHKVAATLRRLHQGPAFPRASTVVGILRIMQTQMLAAAGEALPGDLLRAADEIAARTGRYAESAPCHNDLNPNNVLVDGDRILFVDWDTACAGDPFVDLAQLGVFAFPRPDEREALLEAYLARRPTVEDRARATLARVTALAFYAAAFFLVRAISGAPRVEAESVPLAEPLQTIKTARERTDPGTLAASLLLEMQRERATRACAAAMSTLTP